jgi:hypothetical protein
LVLPPLPQLAVDLEVQRQTMAALAVLVVEGEVFLLRQVGQEILAKDLMAGTANKRLTQVEVVEEEPLQKLLMVVVTDQVVLAETAFQV